jgi:GH24 family phage-related lysozyme (muramidase)
MNISTNGKNLIKSFEGCRLYAYKAVSTEQYYTIGWGHYGPDVYAGMTITQKQADDLFDQDIVKYVNPVANTRFGFTPNQNQFDALCSFCYNLGPGIMNDFIGKSANQVASEIPLYNKSGGVVLEGLVRRRKAEVDLFNTPVSTVEERKKVDYIVVYSNDVDKRAAEYLADYLSCPTISSRTPFDYTRVETVYAVGGDKGTYTGYLRAENFITGADRYESCKNVLKRIGKL